jgi:serine/threonine-protein kinase RsbT
MALNPKPRTTLPSTAGQDEQASPAMIDGIRVPIESEAHILAARQQARALAAELGFWSVEQTFIAMAISEVALNIVQYAGKGEIRLGRAEKNGTPGILIVASDRGPGMSDVQLALQEGYSTSGGAGLGLAGAKRLMDEFDIVSEAGKGTTITMKKWVR